MSSMNYKLAAFLIILGVFSGVVFLFSYFLRDFKAEGALSRRIPRWVMELAMSLTGQAMAISMILLGGMNLAPRYLVYLSWGIWILCFLKFCFIIPDIIQRIRRS